MDKTTIQIYKSDLPRINLLRHQLEPALTQPELVKFLLNRYHDESSALDNPGVRDMKR